MPGSGGGQPGDKPPYIDIRVKGFGTDLNALQQAAQNAEAHNKEWEYALVIDKDTD